MRATALAVIIAPVLFTSASLVRAQDESADALLLRARQTLGDVTALARVESLEWSDGFRHHRVRFPDKYRIDQNDSAVLFDGRRLTAWRSPLQPDAREWTASPAPNQRAAGLRRVAEYAVTFLLRTSAVYPTVSIGNSGTFGPIAGRVLAFQPADSVLPPLRVVIESDTARIQGVITESVAESSYLVRALSDYQRVGDVLIPHTVQATRWTREWTPFPGNRPATLRYTDVQLNSISAADMDTSRATGPE